MERYDWNIFSLIIESRLSDEEEHGNEQRNCKKLHVIVLISKDKR
ncbi:unnamed protein product, partial [Adineta steineri]